jgi:murein DD-endopeptidase MepM/ murein hydrolase activator NlpD
VSGWLLSQGYKDSDHPGTLHARGAEFLLAGHNVFGNAWYTGDLDGIIGPKAAAAFKQAKFDIGYDDDELEPTFGPRLRGFLTGETPQTLNMKTRAELRKPKFLWPTVPRGIVIGWPGQGTHSFRLPPNNWESDNAWDIAVPLGSKIVAIADGVIGPQFGPLPDPDPRFHGIRLHLVAGADEFYYAHLSATAKGIKPGAKVKRGDALGFSGSANGVAHLHIATKRLFALIKQAA